MSAKPGRNDPCPCGSGRKYKHCCANIGTSAANDSPDLLRARSPTPPSWQQQAVAELSAGRLRAALALAEPACRRDPAQRECAAFADQVFSVVNTVCDDFIRGVSAQSTLRVQHIRGQLVEAISAMTPGTLVGVWNLFARPHAKLLSCGLRDFVRAQPEEEFLQRLIRRLPLTAEQAPDWEALLAAMLLARNFELPLVADFEKVPEWVRPCYFAVLLESPQVFNRNGEAEQYVDFLERLTDRVHEGCVRTPPGQARPAMRDFATLFAARGNFTQAYFSSRNLRSLYQMRGDNISAFAIAQGLRTLTGIPPDPDPADRKIRLGIFAHRFTPCTETYFTLSHFEHLDRNRFDITLYALSGSDHPLETYCKSRADRFVVLHPNEVGAQVQRIRDDQLDVLLLSTNMTTHTITSMLLGSARMAPLQIASVSSPVTTGGRHTDVMLSAEWNETEPDAQEHYSEFLERMPGSVNYYAFQHDHDPLTLEVDRQKLGVPADAILFFSGANFFKILPELSDTWVRILAAVPNSVLLLMPFNPNWGSQYQRLPFFARIQYQLHAHGVAAERFKVMDTVPTRADVLRVVSLADVYLDAYPFAGACSMLDSILACVPAVVRRGSVGRSNHGASLLRMVGLEELSCATEEQYIAKAVALANDGAERQRIREHLTRLKEAEVPVYYDTALFSSRVGAALTRLHGQLQSRLRRLAADPPMLRRSIEESAARLVGQRIELNALTDIGIIWLLVEPFFRGPPGQTRRMVDVGACHGLMVIPLLARGWEADLLEPDPAAREVLQRNLVPYTAQTRVHAMAAGSHSSGAVKFHQATVQGLSGLGESPFGTTATVLEVPCVTLTDFCRQQSLTRIDFLKIDAEGYDFDVLESLDFEQIAPELVLVEYGTHFPRQTLAVVNEAIARMAARGYGAVTFSYADDGNFRRAVWIYRLTGISVDRPLVQGDAEVFGNILFYRADNPRLPLILQGLLDSCEDPRTRFSAA